MNCFECAKANDSVAGRRCLPALRCRALPRPSRRGRRPPGGRHHLCLRARHPAHKAAARCPGRDRRSCATSHSGSPHDHGRAGPRAPASSATPTLALLAKALGHRARVRILRLLLSRDACYCGQIVDEIPLAQATVSQHLKVLKDAGLVSRRDRRPAHVLLRKPRAPRRSATSFSARCWRRRWTWIPVAATETIRRPAASPPPEDAAVLRKLSTLDRFLPLWIALAMAVGLGLGRLIPESQRRPRQAARRHGQPADRARSAADDVSGAGEGPLRGARSREDRRRLRPALLRRVVVPLVGDRAAVHVHAGLALPRRPARLPHRRDHRRPRALHRDGADLERSRQGRPRPGRGAGRLQRALPGRRVLAARLLLPDRAAGLARPRHAGFRGRHLGGGAHGADLPRHPARRRVPHPPDRAEAQGTRLVRQPLPAEDRPDHPVRVAVHDRGAVSDPGRHHHLAAAGRRDDRACLCSPTSRSCGSPGSRSAS